MRVDPTGVLDEGIIDDYFTIDGKYLGNDGDENSHNIRITDENTYHDLVGINDREGVPLLQKSEKAVLFNEATMTSEAKLKVYNYYNFTGLPMVIDENLSENAVMSYSTTKQIKVPVERNSKLKIINSYDNIKSTINHEYKHYLDHKRLGNIYYNIPSSVRELWAIWYQRGHPDFHLTTTDYKESTARYLNINFQKLLDGDLR